VLSRPIRDIGLNLQVDTLDVVQRSDHRPVRTETRVRRVITGEMDHQIAALLNAPFRACETRMDCRPRVEIELRQIRDLGSRLALAIGLVETTARRDRLGRGAVGRMASRTADSIMQSVETERKRLKRSHGPELGQILLTFSTE
jgi:hypothetical protein